MKDELTIRTAEPGEYATILIPPGSPLSLIQTAICEKHGEVPWNDVSYWNGLEKVLAGAYCPHCYVEWMIQSFPVKEKAGT